ncbi:MAG: NAD-dependent epimerase/dehydratase family protein [bacterium]
MKILVTGAAGFIGFHLSNKLLDLGHTVVGLDNFNNYYSVELKRSRHEILEKRSGYTGVEADVCDYNSLTSLFQTHQFDRVCHLAAQAGVRYSITHPFAYQKANSEGFLNILESCRHAKTPRLVFASSSSVYGGNKKLPFSETDPVDTPVSLYAATKKANELNAYTYTHLYGLQTVGLRFFTVYGPWGRPDMAMWLFTEAMLAGKSIMVFNNGEMRRDFTFVDDIIQGVVGSLFAEKLEPYEIFNIGNHRSEKLLDMIDALGQALGVTPKMEFFPLQPGDVPVTYADIGRIQSKCGYQPTTPISIGIPKFVEWYKGYMRIQAEGI